jgi:hypothetical protein
MTSVNSFRFNKLRTSSVANVEIRKQKLPIWIEWNEHDVNAEKWEVANKTKETKTKPGSAQVVNYTI